MAYQDNDGMILAGVDADGVKRDVKIGSRNGIRTTLDITTDISGKELDVQLSETLKIKLPENKGHRIIAIGEFIFLRPQFDSSNGYVQIKNANRNWTMKSEYVPYQESTVGGNYNVLRQYKVGNSGDKGQSVYPTHFQYAYAEMGWSVIDRNTYIATGVQNYYRESRGFTMDKTKLSYLGNGTYGIKLDVEALAMLRANKNSVICNLTPVMYQNDPDSTPLASTTKTPGFSDREKIRRWNHTGQNCAFLPVFCGVDYDKGLVLVRIAVMRPYKDLDVGRALKSDDAYDVWNTRSMTLGPKYNGHDLKMWGDDVRSSGALIGSADGNYPSSLAAEYGKDSGGFGKVNPYEWSFLFGMASRGRVSFQPSIANKWEWLDFDYNDVNRSYVKWRGSYMTLGFSMCLEAVG